MSEVIPEVSYEEKVAEEETTPEQIIPDTFVPEAPIAEATIPTQSEDVSLPPWLAGIGSAEIEAETREILAENTEVEAPVDNFVEAPAETPIVAEAPVINASDDLPDWLKSSITQTSPVVPEAPAMEASTEFHDTVSKAGRPKKKKQEEEEEDHGAQEIALPEVPVVSVAPSEDVSSDTKAASPADDTKPKKKRTKKAEDDNLLAGSVNTDDLPDWLK